MACLSGSTLGVVDTLDRPQLEYLASPPTTHYYVTGVA
jgi:hypothetical protein